MARNLGEAVLTIKVTSLGASKTLMAFEKAVRSLSKTMERIRKPSSQAAWSLRAFNNMTVKAKNGVKAFNSTSSRLKNQMQGIGNATRTASKAVGRLATKLNSIKAGMRAFRSISSRVSTGVKRMGMSLRGAIKSFSVLGTTIYQAGRSMQMTGLKLTALGAAGLYGIKSALSAGISFEHEMSVVKVKADQAGVSFEQLEDKALELGRTTVFTASEAANGMRRLAQAGLNTNEIFSVTKDVMDLAANGETDVGTAAQIVTGIMRPFNLKAKEMTDVVDALTYVSNKTRTDIVKLGNSFSYASALTSTMGMNVKDVSAMFGILAQNSQWASKAGTSLNQMFTALAKRTPQAQKAAEKYIKGGLKNLDFSKPLEVLSKFSGMLKDKEGLTDALRIFGTRGGRAAFALIKSADALKKFRGNLNNIQGLAARSAKKQYEDVYGSLKMTTSRIETLFIALFKLGAKSLKSMLDNLVGILDHIIKWVNKNKDLAKTISWIVTGFFTFLSVLGTFMLVGGSVLIFIGGVIKGFVLLAGALSSIGVYFIPLIALLGILGGAFTLLLSLIPLVVQVFKDTKDRVAGAIWHIKKALKEMGDIFTKVTSAFGKGKWKEIILSQMTIFKKGGKLRKYIFNFLQWIKDFQKNLTSSKDAIVKVLTKFTQQVLKRIGKLADKSMNRALKSLINLLDKFGITFGDLGKQKFSLDMFTEKGGAWKWIKRITKALWWLADVVLDTFDIIVDYVFGFWQGFSGTFDDIWDAIEHVGDAFKGFGKAWSDIVDDWIGDSDDGMSNAQKFGKGVGWFIGELIRWGAEILALGIRIQTVMLQIYNFVAKRIKGLVDLIIDEIKTLSGPVAEKVGKIKDILMDVFNPTDKDKKKLPLATRLEQAWPEIQKLIQGIIKDIEAPLQKFWDDTKTDFKKLTKDAGEILTKAVWDSIFSKMGDSWSEALDRMYTAIIDWLKKIKKIPLLGQIMGIGEFIADENKQKNVIEGAGKFLADNKMPGKDAPFAEKAKASFFDLINSFVDFVKVPDIQTEVGAGLNAIVPKKTEEEGGFFKLDTGGFSGSGTVREINDNKKIEFHIIDNSDILDKLMPRIRRALALDGNQNFEGE